MMITRWVQEPDRMAGTVVLATSLALAVSVDQAQAQDQMLSGLAGLAAPLTPTVQKAGTIRSWMASDVQGAWDKGYTGAGSKIMIIDDFSSTYMYTGNLDDGMVQQNHATWMYQLASYTAPGATMLKQSHPGDRVTRAPTGLTIFNLSFGLMDTSTQPVVLENFSPEEISLTTFARNGTAVLAKAAGNWGKFIDGRDEAGERDDMNMLLVGTKSAIFVGALNMNGSPTNKAHLNDYSDRPGPNVTVQRQFLTVGVEAQKTKLDGTSAAAPIICAYAAILGSKFKTATPTQITNQLLNTARTDTIVNYAPELYGRGEASLSRALAPNRIR